MGSHNSNNMTVHFCLSNFYKRVVVRKIFFMYNEKVKNKKIEIRLVNLIPIDIEFNWIYNKPETNMKKNK